MEHARTQHPNASLTPLGRRKMVDCVIDRGWTIEATAERFQVDAKTVRKWRERSWNASDSRTPLGQFSPPKWCLVVDPRGVSDRDRQPGAPSGR